MRTITEHDRANARMLRALAEARERFYISPDTEAAVLREAADLLAPDIETCPHPESQRLSTTEWYDGMSFHYVTCGRCQAVCQDGTWTGPR